MSLWKKSKSRKLHSLVMASILSFSVTCSVFAESFWSSIGTGEYSWDRDWTLSLSNCGNDGVNSSAFGSYLQYDASSGQLTLASSRFRILSTRLPSDSALVSMH